MFTVIISFLFVIFAQDTTYYVAIDGSDTETCGMERSPCASINQVMTNYPGVSCTVSIASGAYTTESITLQRSAVVVFQGTENPIIVGSWSDSFIYNTNTSGFEFHDLTLIINALYGTSFSKLTSVGNIAGFYNITLIYETYPYGDFIRIDSGALTISNLTFDKLAFNAYLINDVSDSGGDSNISIIGSTFSQLNILEHGSLIGFDLHGSTNLTLDSNYFYDVNSSLGFISLYVQDGNPTITISNNKFDFIYSHYSSVFITIENECAVNINVQNTIWNNSVANELSAALGILGSHDYQDHNITLNSLQIYNCRGNTTGGVHVGFNSLILSNSTFANNSLSPGAGYGNDVVQELDTESAQFGCTITNSYSSSILPKAVIWNVSSGSVRDISDQLPNPSSPDVEFHVNNGDDLVEKKNGMKI